MNIFTKFPRLYQRVVSVFVLVVLAAQASTLIVQVVFGRGTTGSRYWPILVYDMYAKTRHKDDIIDVHYLLEGVLDNGRVVSIPRESLGIDFWHYVKLTRSIVGGAQDATGTLFELLRQYYPDQRFAEIRVKNYPLKLAKDGAVPAESTVIYTMPVTGYGE